MDRRPERSSWPCAGPITPIAPRAGEWSFQAAPLDLEAIVSLRHELHALAETSGGERRTAARVADVLASCGPDALHAGVGGEGLLARWDGPEPGPTVLLRAELDALPISESLALPYSSVTSGIAHKCGHDGHMATLLGVACWLSGHPLVRGRVALLFQPAEETGAGAARMLAEPPLGHLAPDWVFAMHNLPGFPFGQVVVREGTFALASTGLRVGLIGHTAHAAEPERGKSPALALSQLICAWSAIPQDAVPLHEPVKATVVHARLGEPTLGTTPGEAIVMVTLRAADETILEGLRELASERARGVAACYGLACQVQEVEPFPATCNHPQAIQMVRTAARGLGLDVLERPHPFPWSEDFGHLTRAYPGALFGLGAGEEHPALHHPQYDFPDGLLGVGLAIYLALLAPQVGEKPEDEPPIVDSHVAG